MESDTLIQFLEDWILSLDILKAELRGDKLAGAAMTAHDLRSRMVTALETCRSPSLAGMMPEEMRRLDQVGLLRLCDYIDNDLVPSPWRDAGKRLRMIGQQLRALLATLKEEAPSPTIPMHCHCDWCSKVMEPDDNVIESHGGEFVFCTERHLELYCRHGKCGHCEPLTRDQWLDVTERMP